MTNETPKTSMFISYSRADVAFVHKLQSALNAPSLDVWVDMEDIPKGAKWWQEICAGIEGADTFVFVISPDSLKSEVCNQEIAHAVALQKRIVPILWRPVESNKDLLSEIKEEWHSRDWEASAQENWRLIKAINWLLFQIETDFEANLTALLEAIETDPERVKMHTKLIVRALEWDRNKRKAEFLLRGSDLNRAEEWLVSGADQKPQPTELQSEYIITSRHTANTRQRTLTGGLTVGLLVMSILAVLSFVLFQQSEANLSLAEERGTGVAQQAQIAETNAERAEQNAVTATFEQGRAESNAATATNAQGEAQNNAATSEARLNEVLNRQSLALANQSGQALSSFQYQRSLLLALRSLENYPAVQNANSQTALFDALVQTPRESFFVEPPLELSFAKWSPDETLVLIAAEHVVYVYASNDSSAPLLQLNHTGTVHVAEWSPDGSWIATATTNEMRLWNSTTGELAQARRLQGFDLKLVFSPTGGDLLFYTDAQAIVARIHSDGTIVDTYELSALGDLRLVAWQPDGSQLATCTLDSAVESQLTLIDADDGQVVHTYAEEGLYCDEFSGGIEWSPDGQHYLFYAENFDSQNQPVLVVNAATGDVDHMLGHSLSSDEIEADVLYADYSLDGQWIVTTSEDNTARLWNAASGGLLHSLPHDGPVVKAVWSPMSDRVLTWEDSGSVVYVWDVNTGQRVSMTDLDESVDTALWDSGGRVVLGWSFDELYAFDPDEGQPSRTEILKPNLNTGIDGITLNRAETRLLLYQGEGALTGAGNVVIIYDYTQRGIPLALDHPGSRFSSLFSSGPTGASLNADESRLVSWTPDAAYLWAFPSGRKIADLRHDDLWASPIWLANGDLLLTISSDGVHLYATFVGEERARFVHETDSFSPAKTIELSDDEQQLLTMWEGVARLWDISNSRTPLVTLFADDPSENAYTLTWDQSSNRIARITSDVGEEDVVVADLDTGEILLRLDGDADGAEFLTQDRLLVTGNDFGATVYDLVTGQVVQVLVSEAPDNAILLAGNTRLLLEGDGTLKLWDLDTLQTSLDIANRPYLGVTFSEDEQQIVVAFEDHSFLVVETLTATIVYEFDLGVALVDAYFDQAGERLVVATETSHVLILDITSGKILHEVQSEDPLLTALWSQAESKVIIVSDSGTGAVVSVWDVARGDITMQLRHHLGEESTGLNGVLTTADDSLILTLGTDELLRVFPSDAQTLIDIGREVVTRDLNNTELQAVSLPTVVPTATITPYLTATPLPSPTPSPTMTPSPTFTPSPTPIAAPEESELMQRLASEGYIDNTGGHVAERSDWEIDLSGEESIIRWRTFDGTYRDFVMHSTVTWKSQAETASCGFFFRGEDNDNYYVLEIYANGLVYFQETLDDEWVDYDGLGYFGAADALDSSESSLNQLTLVVRRNEFSLFVNGIFVKTFTDPTHLIGEAGVVAGIEDQRDVSGCVFTNTWIWPLEGSGISANEYNEAGILAFSAGDYNEARDAFLEAVALSPDSAVMWTNLGSTYNQLAQYTEAINAVERALEIDPNYGYAYGHRGTARYYLGQYEDAVNDLELGVAVDMSFGWVLGNADYEMGDYPKAIEDYSVYLGQYPTDDITIWRRALAHFMNHDSQAALDDMTMALALNPEDSNHLYFRALFQLDLGNIAATQEDLGSSFALDSTKLNEALVSLWHGMIALSQGDLAQHSIELERARLATRLVEDEVARRRLMALLMVADRNLVEAQATYVEAFQTQPYRHQWVAHFVYLELLNRLFPDETVFVEVQSWFEAQFE